MNICFLSLKAVVACLDSMLNLRWISLGTQDLSLAELIFAYVPLTLHFGWTTAAMLVNWTGWLVAVAHESF